MAFLTDLNFNANWWAIVAGGFAALFFMVGLTALMRPRRDWGYVWIGLAALVTSVMFGGNLAFLLTNNLAGWPYLGYILLFRNVAGSLAFVATIIAIVMVWRSDR